MRPGRRGRPVSASAGAAAALSGFVLALGAFIMGAWLGRAIDSRIEPYALTITALALVTVVVAWTLVQRHGEPVARPRAAPVQT